MFIVETYDTFPFHRQQDVAWYVRGLDSLLNPTPITSVKQQFKKLGITLYSHDDLIKGASQKELSFKLPEHPLNLRQFAEYLFVDLLCEDFGFKEIPSHDFLFQYCGTLDDPNVYRVFYPGEIQLLNESPDSFIRISKRDNDLGEEDLDYSVEEYAKQTRDRVEKLLSVGIPQEVIESWLQTYSCPSRLHITEKFQIILEDYETDIVLPQLPKTLFLWYLRHEDGCALKDLADHRDELLSIYLRMSIFEDKTAAEKSIDRLINPFSNSFCEKCNIIKNAFLEKISFRKASQYLIVGKQGHVKRIQLDRSLVDWDIVL